MCLDVEKGVVWFYVVITIPYAKLLSPRVAFCLTIAWSGKAVITRGDMFMKGFVQNIGALSSGNTDFRHVLYTARNMQLVLMAIQPGEDIGEEVHKDRDQFFRVEKGEGEVWIDGVRTRIEPETAMIIPAGVRHNVRNTGKQLLQLYTIYAPPEHADGTVRSTKAEAEASEEHYDGRTTE